MKKVTLFTVVFFAAAASGRTQSPRMNTTDGLASACKFYVLVTDKSQRGAEPDKYTQAGFCIGYMAGFAHALSLAASPDICLPESINLTEAVKAFLQYVDEHPEDVHLSAKVTVPRALQKAFPCKGPQ